ncbi:dTDP-4-dehydrorhamnose 3,5-epimerase [Natronincola ferrireducens]|uniref:dTDP-4-dehydrorhamnose 3,5-epimerase n=2 Tax=Natronincola ferrireducens TaxID=393762 RepID=A0A1G9CRQ2_9FIRM|nr:dTDP-4-dehydrorhamnose 3,5-epimerase [Natronincola ferrireducens]
MNSMERLCDLINIDPYEDQRGMLKKIIMKSQLQDSGEVGEVYLLYSNPNSVRGNHYHKKTFEYFTIVSGKAKVALKDLSNGVREEFYLSSNDNIVLKIPPYMVHAFKNEDHQQLIILAVSSKEYSQSNPDTYVKEIL